MSNKKQTGSYYTPDYLAHFITKRVLAHFEDIKYLSVLEPSAGDGAFISELNKNILKINLTAIELDNKELQKAKTKWVSKNASFINDDFLFYKTDKKFSLVIGNPPYVKRNLLKKEQIDAAQEIQTNEGFSDASIKNIWTSFLIKSTTLLTNFGVLAFVLPSELLQVKFAEDIRSYLKSQFCRIEVFTFNDLMFDCKGQDTIVLFAYKKHLHPGEFFTNITNKLELINENFLLKKNNLLVESNVKWTHHFLTDEEITFLNKLKNSLNRINDYCESKPGIVTAANKYFIINKEKEEKYNLKKYTKPIIQKGLYVNGNVEFNEDDFAALEKKYPSRLIQINNSDEIVPDLIEYLKLGVDLDIPNRFKCKERKKWYVIPNISTIPSAFFFKRSHNYPKLLKNNTEALVTDSAYRINTRNGYDLNSLIFSFYNSLTLSFSEIDGRYYGGGVLELTPSEFKNLPLPYLKISNVTFRTFAKKFEQKSNINDILRKNDAKILGNVLGLNKEEIETLQQIRLKLVNKRIR
ncbi:Eco57I restriction-modification methylase domain-containing protein [Saccharicrinis sp. FJH54]|uniref:Eco57I restriction-modification methylase domain-containing protein n=1 Tax=Saccharicrinis sp. FJH54 TaxID=3344665 RepID=UPI0035D4B388